MSEKELLQAMWTAFGDACLNASRKGFDANVSDAMRAVLDVQVPVRAQAIERGVDLARVPQAAFRIPQIEVDAETPDEAEDFALELWADDDEAFTDLGCVHAEEYIQEVEEIKK